MKRRDLLKNGFYLTGGLWLSQLTGLQKAMAAKVAAGEVPPQFLVQIILDGGWHTSLSVDPWVLPQRLDEKDAYIEYLENEVLREGEINLGPAMASMKSFAPQMNVINGIFLSANDNGHQAAQNYILSGKGSGDAGSIAAEFELSQAASVAGVINQGEFFKGSKNVNVTSIDSLKNVQSGESVDSKFQNKESAIYKALQSGQLNADKYQALKNEIEILKQQKIDPKDGHYIALAFKQGLAFSSSVKPSSANGSLDTHSNHPGAHFKAQQSIWEKIAELLNAFKAIEYKDGASMFDVTTFFMTSEFSRTPALDSSKGTNHNPLNNSAVIIGPGFKGNKTFGASRVVTREESSNKTSYLIAQMVDLKTGEILKNKKEAQSRGTLIKPETIIATLATGLKIQRNIFGSVGQDEPAIAQILK